jgi:hypothetical protein
MKDYLNNNNCFYFVNKPMKRLYFQLFFFILCVVFVIFLFLRNNAQGIQLVRHDLVYFLSKRNNCPTKPSLPSLQKCSASLFNSIF